jgi:hypothetical protein
VAPINNPTNEEDVASVASELFIAKNDNDIDGDINEADLNKTNFTHDPKRGVNLGIGIVIPAYKILETLNSPALVRMQDVIAPSPARFDAYLLRRAG